MGSVRQNAPFMSPLAMPSPIHFFCRSSPPIITGCDGSAESSSIRPEAQQYFATSSTASARASMPAPLPPYCCGIVRPGEAGLLERLEDVVRILAGLVHLGGARRDLLLRDAARGLLDQAMFFGELEVHGWGLGVRLSVLFGAGEGYRRVRVGASARTEA